jgi:hypothetical protein
MRQPTTVESYTCQYHLQPGTNPYKYPDLP